MHGPGSAGQRSCYITPGNRDEEAYRISTFLQFTSTAQDPCRLAASGFYYTGYKDRVKCFSCGQCVRDWFASDDPALRRWHQPDCKFANGNDRANVPLNALFHRLCPTRY